MTGKTRRQFDEKPDEISVQMNGGAVITVAVRTGIVQEEMPAMEGEESGETRMVWVADEQEQGGLSVCDYETLVGVIVRIRYSVDAELAILRQRDTKPEEFAEYNAFAEAAKAKAAEVFGK